MNYLKMRNNFRVILALRVALKSEGDRANIPETVSHCLIIIALSLHDSSCKMGYEVEQKLSFMSARVSSILGTKVQIYSLAPLSVW